MKKRMLIVVDMQKDFIDGSLGSPQAQAIVPGVVGKIKEYVGRGDIVVYTQDTHYADYLDTQEGKRLPVVHCVENTEGWEIDRRLWEAVDFSVLKGYRKNVFGSLELAQDIAAMDGIEEIELCGLCSDICVVSNALILKAALPETKITVDARCCAGVTEESHQAALATMKMCQVEVIGVSVDYTDR